MLKFRLVLMALVLAITAFGQNKIISGRITDDKGEALPFATIRVKGTKTAPPKDLEIPYSNIKTAIVQIVF